jgi:copper homeostasis protein CutC
MRKEMRLVNKEIKRAKKVGRRSAVVGFLTKANTIANELREQGYEVEVGTFGTIEVSGWC